MSLKCGKKPKHPEKTQGEDKKSVQATPMVRIESTSLALKGSNSNTALSSSLTHTDQGHCFLQHKLSGPLLLTLSTQFINLES